MTEPEVPLLEVCNAQVCVGKRLILDVPNERLYAGRNLAIVGPNGSGKTTLLLAMATLRPLQSGALYYRQKQIELRSHSQSYRFRQRIAVVFQQPLLLNTTVFDNVATGLKLRKLPRDEIARRVCSAMDLFEIAHLRKRSIKNLSGGEAQRTSLARAFALEPEILFLDEPFSALDIPSREALFPLLEIALQTTRTTTVLVTHDRQEALRFCKQLCVMQNGQAVEQGLTDDICLRPKNNFVARFFGISSLEGSRKAGFNCVE